MIRIKFARRFAGPVADRSKRQTVRRADKNTPIMGDELRLYARRWFFFRRRLRDAICTSALPVVIYRGDMMLNHEMHHRQHDDGFAKRSGFEDFREMSRWFDDRYGLPFYGAVIKWK